MLKYQNQTKLKKKMNNYSKIFNVTFKNYLNYMESFQIDRALKNIFEYLSEVNAYVDDQAPWALKKTDSIRMQDCFIFDNTNYN